LAILFFILTAGAILIVALFFFCYILFEFQQFENDNVLIPKETSWFGYYPDGAFKPIVPAHQV
jgi:hypothetical protein